MDNNELNTSINVDKKKAEQMLKRIIILENNNVKTKRYNDQDMVKNIKKLIEEEVECY